MADVFVSGPLFDGRAVADLHKGLEVIRKDVAERGRQLTVAAFNGSIKVNTGRFIASINVIKESKLVETRSGHKTYTMPVVVDSAVEDVVTTDIASYGPWLEGTGSRNQTTRFKGYHGYRLSAQTLDHVAAAIADIAIKPYVREMN